MKKLNRIAVMLLVIGIALVPSLSFAADQTAVAAKVDLVKKEVVKKAPKYVASNLAASKLYHIPTCASAKNIKAENLVGFANKADAAKAGYTAHDCVPVKKVS